MHNTFVHTHTNPDGSAVALLVEYLENPPEVEIHPTVQIGRNVTLFPYAPRSCRGTKKIAIDPYVRIGDGVMVACSLIEAGVQIGSNTRVRAGSIGVHSVIGDGVVIEGTDFTNGVKIGNRVKIGSQSHVISGHMDAELGDDISIGNAAKLDINGPGNDVVLPPGSRIGSDSKVVLLLSRRGDAPLYIGESVTAEGLYLGGYHEPRFRKPAHVGNGAWIGSESTLLPGAVIPACAILPRKSVVGPDNPVMVTEKGKVTIALGPRDPSVLGELSPDAMDLLRQIHTWVAGVRAESDQRMKAAEGRVRAGEEKAANVEAKVAETIAVFESRLAALESYEPSVDDDGSDYEDDQPTQ